ncbi:MAG: helix-turn-helix transcriptional regulator [Clostridia bacterium]|nr:helix-turn-helix transcriptional regulator [Clostridia bacterium]
MAYYEQFERLMDEYNAWYYEKTRDLTKADMVGMLDEMLPIELYLKELWQSGNAISMWSRDESESYRFRYLDHTETMVAYRHFRYDYRDMHAHQYYQFNYILRGAASICIRDDKIDFRAGDFILISPGTPHRLMVFDDDYMVLKYYMRSSTFDRAFYKWLGESNALSDLLRQTVYDKKNNSYMIFHTGDDEVLRELALELMTELTCWRKYRSILGECKLTEIFCLLARDYMDDAFMSSREGSSGVGMIVKYIIDNRRTETLDELAAKSGYSKNYLCRLLMKRTGKSFLQILNSARIEAAVSMLNSTDMSMEEIAVNAGFTGVKQFYRVFRQYHDTTPTAWREGLQ